MMDLAPDVFTYGLAAGLSGTAFLATVILLATDDGPANVLGLLGGIVLILGTAAVLAAVAADLLTAAGGELVVASLLKLGLGVLLLSLAWKVRPDSGGGPALEAKLAAMEGKLRHLRPATAFRVGIAVAVLPKRLAITVLAGAAIGVGQTSLAQGLGLVVLYLLTATVLIWATLVAYLVGGSAARERLERARAWVVTNAAILAFVVTLLFGVIFSGQAIVELLA